MWDQYLGYLLYLGDGTTQLYGDFFLKAKHKDRL